MRPSTRASIHSSRLRRRVVAEHALVGDPPVGAAEDQDLHQLLEDHPIGDAGAVAAERMVDPRSGRRASNCCQMGSMMYGWSAGTGMLLPFGKLRELPE